MLEKEVPKKSKKKLYILALVGIAIIIVVVGSYLWQQNQMLLQLQEQAKQEAEARKQVEQQQEAEKQSVNSISVQLTKFTYTQSSLYFTADTEFTIYNNGALAISLDKATTTLYVNDINVQAKSFQSQVLVIPAYSSTTYTGTYGTFDSGDASTLQTATQFRTQLELSAMATCGSYSSGISVSHQETWYPTAT